MRVLKRIVHTTTIANRVPEGTMVIPQFPDIREYAKSVTCNKKAYEELLRCYQLKIPVPAQVSDMASAEIGYILEHENRRYAVPKPYLKSFMVANGVMATEASPVNISINVFKNGVIINGNNAVSVSSDSVVYIYYTDYENPVETRVPVQQCFYVQKKSGLQRIVPKGLAIIPGVKLLNEDILGVIRGEVIDVSWDGKYRHE